MLLSLHIENIAVIKSVDFEFTRGFMVLTGETGAGKSIVIDSINLLLGAKGDKELIRTGAPQAMVSGLFGELSDSVLRKLSEVGISVDDDGTVLVQRVLTPDGRSKINLNGRSISISLLKSITPLLVNIHGQSDTAALMESKNHLELLDTYANCSELRERYSVAYAELEAVRQQIRDITEKANESERLKEILEYQIKDIDSVSPYVGEEEELIEKKVKIKNSEKITRNSEFVFKALKGSEKGSVSYLLDRSATALTQISDVVPGFAEFSERLRDVLYQIDDVAEEVYAVISDIDENPEDTINKIESRLDKISKLKRKYGLTVAAVLEFREKAEAELSTLENSEALLKSLSSKEKSAYNTALALAEELHKARVTVLRTLKKASRKLSNFWICRRWFSSFQ